MDPRTALMAVLNPETNTREQREALNQWVARGGFAPRVELHPATNRWMRGDRYGEVIAVGRAKARVKFDRSGQVALVPLSDLTAL